MKKYILLITLAALLNSCKKSETVNPVSTAKQSQINSKYIILIIGRNYIALDDQVRYDTLLSTSHWGKPTSQIPIPELSLISHPESYITTGYNQFQDTLFIQQGDSVSLTLNLKHRWDYGLCNGGLWITFLSNYYSAWGQSMCLKDTICQTISFKLP